MSVCEFERGCVCEIERMCERESDVRERVCEIECVRERE